MIVKYIAYYWHNPCPLPAWRQACVDRLIELYPDAEVIRHESTLPYGEGEDSNSNLWRIKKAATYKYFLWVDNDIYLDSPLALTEMPAMVDEYNVRHWSVLWSGSTPEIFAGKAVTNFRYDQRVEKIQITGIHWTTNRDGLQIDRRTLYT